MTRVDTQQISEQMADIEREYREAVAAEVDDLVLAAAQLQHATLTARACLLDQGSDDALKDAHDAYASRLETLLTKVASARGTRTKAMKKAGIG